MQQEAKLVIGTRKSRLAMVQTDQIKSQLQLCHPQLSIEVIQIVTTGDLSQVKNEALPSIGGKGLFTAELEDALAERRIDLAVHSLKDLPTTLDPRFCVGAVTKRETVADAFISRSGKGFHDLPAGACVGTSSLRREAQIRMLRSDLRVQSIRGNIDTRIEKLRAAGTSYDAIVLAEAGLNRIGRGEEITETFAISEMVPAAAQGALGIQCRVGDERILAYLKPLHDEQTAAETCVEREFLATLQAGCNTPIGCVAWVVEGRLHCLARALSKDGSRSLEVSSHGEIARARQIGRELGEEMLERGVRNLEL